MIRRLLFIHLAITSGLILIAPPTATAAVSQPAIVNPPVQVFAASPALGTVTATSEFDCGFIVKTCRFTYTLETGAIDPGTQFVDVRWYDPNTPFDVSATMNLFGDFKQWYLDIPNGTLSLAPNPPVANGLVRFSGTAGLLNNSGNAEYYVPPSKPIPLKGILEELGDMLFGLDNGLVENPTLASFYSSVEPLPGGEYRYSYTVSNGTGVTLTYDWPDAGLSGELGVGETASTTIDSPLLPFSVIGLSSTSYMGGSNQLREFRTPTNTILPLVPEPSTAILAIFGMFGVVAKRRR